MSAEEEKTEKEENLLGAIARGTTDGLHLALNIAAMLISFLALIALVDGIFGGIHNHVAWFPESLEHVFGVIFAPVAWVIGIPAHDCRIVGNLLGTRMVLNELVAFSMLGAQKAALDPRSVTIATFALCGFANLSSIGIQIGGIGALAPNKTRRTGAPWCSRHAGGNHGQPDVGFDRRHAALDVICSIIFQEGFLP